MVISIKSVNFLKCMFYVYYIWVYWGLRRLDKVCTCSIEYSICAYEWWHVYNCLTLLQLLHYIILILYKFVTLMTELNLKHLQFSSGESLSNPPRSLCPWIFSLDYASWSPGILRQNFRNSAQDFCQLCAQIWRKFCINAGVLRHVLQHVAV